MYGAKLLVEAPLGDGMIVRLIGSKTGGSEAHLYLQFRADQRPVEPRASCQRASSAIGSGK